MGYFGYNLGVWHFLEANAYTWVSALFQILGSLLSSIISGLAGEQEFGRQGQTAEFNAGTSHT
jgi:hypothetical protein